MFQISDSIQQNRSALEGARVSILGAARSGLALARLLNEHGAKVLLSDQKAAGELNLSVTDLEKRGIQCEFGGHSPRTLKADLMAISPGIPITAEPVQKALQARIPVLGELEIASWFCDAPIIAITGSNGKTTTTTLLGEMLRQRHPELIVGGNIGAPLAEQVMKNPAATLAVVEVSSFQLETIFNFAPKYAIILNLSPNHLDRYSDYQAYIHAKMQILKNVGATDTLVYNADDTELTARAKSAPGRKLSFSIRQEIDAGAFWADNRIIIRIDGEETIIPVPQTYLRGPHNRYNMTVAAMLAHCNGATPEQIATALRSFQGVEHRLEFVAEIDGVSFFNDSKATTVASLGYALQSFHERIVLIAGGKDKGGDFAAINSLLQSKVRAAIVIGQAAEKMRRAWKNVTTVENAASLAEAVRQAKQQAKPGEVVVLSPACSSFDMFRDYEDRGRQYKKLVHQLKEGGTAQAATDRK